MDILSHLFFGFAMAFTGIFLPGLTSMTSVRVSLLHGLESGMYYSAGASTTVFLQALIAVVFTGYLVNHPEVFAYLEKAAVFIFIGLCVVFLYLGLRRKPAKSSARQGGAFFTGMAVTSMNVMAIPYYFAFSALIKTKGLVTLESAFRWIFLAGVPLGALCLLALYIYFARYIAERAETFTRNINFFLSGLFLFLAIVQLAR